jgi:hypothetical protein
LPWLSPEHLHLDVARAQDIFLDQHPVVAERSAASRLQLSSMSGNSAEHSPAASPLPAAAGHRLDQHG